MVLASKSIEDQLNSSDVLSSVPDMFSPNEDKFWEALNTVHIPVAKSDTASHVVVDVDGEEQVGAEQTQQQEQAQQDRGAGAQEQVKELLRDHMSRNKRLFDILYFNKTSSGSLPLFEVIPTRCRSISKEELLKDKEVARDEADGSGSVTVAADVAAAPTKVADTKERVIAKISDSQMQCIVCLKPTLLYPSMTDQAWSEQALAATDGDGNICTSIRNRKQLGNYKNTGFCHKHVYGTESASAQAYLDTQCKSVRGFNLKRKTGECRIRHLLCLEFSGKGKVFLKWCTQCHLWKNFNEFYRDCNIDTFCDVCQQRQKESRNKQLLKRRNKKEKPLQEAAPVSVPPGAVIPFSNEGQKADVVVVDAAVMEVNAALTGADAMQTEPTPPPPPSTSPVAVGNSNNNGNNHTNGTTGMSNENANGNVSIIDAPKTPEIQEIQEQQQQKENNGADAGTTAPAAPTEGVVDKWRPIAKGPRNQQDAERYARQHRIAVVRKKRTGQEMNMGGKDGGPVEMAMEMVEAKENQQALSLNGHRKKKNKRRPNMDPEQADRLKEFQMNLLRQIPLVDFPFWHHNESDFIRALDSVVVDKKSLREYYFRDDRLGDILFFRKDSLPGFVKESNPIPKRGMLPQLMSDNDASKYYPNMRISDTQTTCINSLKPLLIYPMQEQLSDGIGSTNTWKHVEPKVAPCTSVRSTTEAKKRNENYKFTGFCPDCVHGVGDASQETFVQTGCTSIRGFNLGRKKVDHRLRHLMCLEDKDGSKVFLKWCTQCHTWKNFSSFLKRETGPTGPIQKLNTFCAVCNRRQVVSRRMQSETRVVSQTQKAASANASFRVPVTDNIVDKNSNGQQQKIVV